jgi:anti-sigma regulatory factor (Ser/Thr protein kinase)
VTAAGIDSEDRDDLHVAKQNKAVAKLLQQAAAAQREADAVCQPVIPGRHRRCDGSAPGETVRRCYPAQLSSVPLARAAVVPPATQAGLRPDQLHAVRLAVSEAVTNAAVHAYPSSPGQIHLTAVPADGELIVIVADDGVGPLASPQNPGPGWGLPLMSACSDRLTISQRGTGGTLVEIRWNVGDDRETAASDADALAAARATD